MAPSQRKLDKSVNGPFSDSAASGYEQVLGWACWTWLDRLRSHSELDGWSRDSSCQSGLLLLVQNQYILKRKKLNSPSGVIFMEISTRSTWPLKYSKIKKENHLILSIILVFTTHLTWMTSLGYCYSYSTETWSDGERRRRYMAWPPLPWLGGVDVAGDCHPGKENEMNCKVLYRANVHSCSLTFINSYSLPPAIST